jgi:lysophospholipase L1-like esterase
MKLWFSVLIVLVLPGYSSSNVPGIAAKKNHMLNYLALGDSYTIGESVPAGQSFPYQLVNELNKSKHHLNKPEITATTGWTTDELIDAISQRGIAQKKYDLVTLLIGVNDQYRGLSQENYKIKFQQVLLAAIKFADGNKKHVFVLSIPDYGVTPFGKENEGRISAEIDRFNGINKESSTSQGVNYLDITGISRRAKNEQGLVAPDGLHPSAKMYALWVGLL